MKYLIAVKIESNCDIFEFETKEQRDSFIQSLIEADVEYAVSDVWED